MDELEKLMKLAAEHGYVLGSYKCSAFEVDLTAVPEQFEHNSSGIDVQEIQFIDEDGNPVDPDDFDTNDHN